MLTRHFYALLAYINDDVYNIYLYNQLFSNCSIVMLFFQYTITRAWRVESGLLYKIKLDSIRVLAGLRS